MWHRYRKEIRLLLPAWLLTLTIPWAPRPFFPGIALWEGAFILVGCVIVAASSFGPEFSHRTLALLIAQPLDRGRIWSEKMLVLGAGLFPFCIVLFAVMVNSVQIVGSTNFAPRQWQEAVDIHAMLNNFLCFLPICIFCITPYLTLVSRSTIAAIVFSFCIPMVLWVGSVLLSLFLEKWGLHVHHALIDSAALVASCVVFYWLGYTKFKKLQVIDAVAEEMPFGRYLEAPFRLLLDKVFSSGRGVVMSLIKKELRIQQVTVMVAVAFCLCQIGVVAFIDLAQPSSSDSELYFATPLLLYVGMLPIIIGALAVAQEKSLGIHTWHLTLPVSALKQWSVKLLVAFTLSLLLGGLLPLAWVLGQHWLCPLLPSNELEYQHLLVIGCLQLLVTAIALYASSLTNNTLSASVLSIAFVVGFGVCLPLAGRAFETLGSFEDGL